MPDAQTTDIGTPLVFSDANANAIAVGDSGPSDTPLTVSISVFYGSLALSGTANLTFTQGTGTNDSYMTFTGVAAG